MLVVDDDPLLTDGFVSAFVLVNTPVTAPPAQDTVVTGHAPRQLFDRCTVIDDEVSLCDHHIIKTKRQDHCDEILSMGHHRDLARIWGVAGDPHGADNSRTVAVLKKTGVELSFLQYWESRDKEGHRAGLVLADISRAEVLNGQTLQLHVKAPEPLSRLVSTCTLQL